LNCTSGDDPCTVMVSATVASPISRSTVTSPRCGTRTVFCDVARNPAARGDVVSARIDEVEPVAPFGVGDTIGRDTGGFIQQRHGDAGQRAAALVRDLPLHRAR
jgi:hypothetical protein